MIRGLEILTYKERLMEMVLFNLERKAYTESNHVLPLPKEKVREKLKVSFIRMHGNRIRGNGPSC